jgi:HlyD family secretion protein
VRLPKHPGILIAAVVVGALLTWGFWPRPLPVEAVIAARGPMTVTIEEDGRTRVIDRYEIRAPVDGFASRVELDVGDPVAAGQVLFVITPLRSAVLDPRSRAEARARVAAADAALASTRQDAEAAGARAEFRAAELARVEPLAKRGLVSSEELDQARMETVSATAALRAARHAVDVARYELEAARTALAYSEAGEEEPAERIPVRSPIDGRVLKVLRDGEGPVGLGDVERWGGETLEGVVRTVEPAGFTKISALGVEEQRVLVIADFTSPRERWERLGDGYRVEARFVLWQRPDVLQVPASSLFRHGDGWAVLVVADGRAGLRPVEVGQRTGLRAQVLAGLEAGEPVIDHPADAVADGARVSPR